MLCSADTCTIVPVDAAGHGGLTMQIDNAHGLLDGCNELIAENALQSIVGQCDAGYASGCVARVPIDDDSIIF